MLQGMTWASPPAFRMPSATSWQASALRLEITTLAPSFASSSADERPMPRLEPVMTATLPLRSNGVFFIFVGFPVARYSGPAPQRAHPGMSKSNQSPAVGDAAQVIVGVAKGVLDHRQPLEVMADLGFLGHAN